MRPKVFFYYLCHADNDIVVGLDCEHKFNILINRLWRITLN